MRLFKRKVDKKDLYILELRIVTESNRQTYTSKHLGDVIARREYSDKYVDVFNETAYHSVFRPHVGELVLGKTIPLTLLTNNNRNKYTLEELNGILEDFRKKIKVV